MTWKIYCAPDDGPSVFSTTIALLLTVFLIVFVTQLISWIGQKVLLEWVSSSLLLFLLELTMELGLGLHALVVACLNTKGAQNRDSEQQI
jgi:apolipoprotein N-acyltransferase